MRSRKSHNVPQIHSVMCRAGAKETKEVGEPVHSPVAVGQ